MYIYTYAYMQSYITAVITCLHFKQWNYQVTGYVCCVLFIDTRASQALSLIYYPTINIYK